MNPANALRSNLIGRVSAWFNDLDHGEKPAVRGVTLGLAGKLRWAFGNVPR